MKLPHNYLKTDYLICIPSKNELPSTKGKNGTVLNEIEKSITQVTERAFAEDDIYIRTFRTAEKMKRGPHVDRCNEYVVKL